MFIPLQNSSNWLPEISNSLRFDGSDDYLYRVPNANAANQNVATISMWIKRSKLGVAQSLLDCYLNTSTRTTFYFYADDTLQISYSNAGTAILTTAKFRDPSAWYHLVYQHNIGLPRLWINGVEAAYTTQNNLGTYACALGYNAAAFGIGAAFNGTTPFDGYIANVSVIVGQSRAPTDFAYTDPNGQWRSLKKGDLQALASAGDNNSFFLPFDNGTDTTTLGNDASSKGNNWTLTNMVRTGGTDDCWSYDTPTNNFATLSWIDNGCQILNGALSWYSSGAAWQGCRATQAVPASKVIWEVTVGSGYTQVSVGPLTASLGTGQGNTGVYTWDASAGLIAYGGVTQTTITLVGGDVVGVAVDGVTGTVAFYKNGTLAYTFSQTFSGDVYPSIWTYQTTQSYINFGQRPVASGQWYPEAGGYFRYAPPTGYKALSTKNLPRPSIVNSKEHFDITLWTGNATARNITGKLFRPDLVWGKSRTDPSTNHRLIDSVRGATKELYSGLTNAEATDVNGLTNFNSDGFSLGVGSSLNNNTLNSYIGWLWKAGGAAVTISVNQYGAGSPSIASQVSANPAAGFSIVTYTGANISSSTVGHGLGVPPDLVIIKGRGTNGVDDNWHVYHKSVGATGGLFLNLTNATSTSAVYWNNTAPTSTILTVGSYNNQPLNYVAYCFAEVPGFSKIGSYSGNSSTDGTFVWCGFRPKWVLIKDLGGASQWMIFDSARDVTNQMGSLLMPSSSSQELTGYLMDFVSNGFKLRFSAGDPNQSGRNYIFMAFAEAPFKYANAR